MSKDGDILSVTATSGKTYQYVYRQDPPSGTMKKVYFAPDKSYVVAMFKTPQNGNALDRLETLVNVYRRKILGQIGGDYWKHVFCWPTDLINKGHGEVGLVVPAYDSNFFFKVGSPTLDIRGQEKGGKWFTSPWHRFCNLDSAERGDWRSFFNICLKLARGVRRLHMAGLAHSDLSYNNVLVDPISQSAVIIDIDGLVVPGKYAPDVLGTPDFIAPEVMETLGAPVGKRKLPCRETDLHALAVLIYMYLLCRHPLRGRKIWDIEDEKHDEALVMGEKALFIENAKDLSNLYDVDWVKDNYPKNQWPYLFPWMDIKKLPYTVLGPYLSKLIEQAFVQGLHNPALRPTANDWEDALVRTMDMLQPCTNPKCPQKWFVFDNTKAPRCPFCGQRYTAPLPVIDLYTPHGSTYRLENWRIMVFNGTRLYPWHAHREIFPGEKLTDAQRKPVACFQFHKGTWYLRNEGAQGMKDASTGSLLPVGSALPLRQGTQILLDGPGSRQIHVQIVNGGN